VDASSGGRSGGNTGGGRNSGVGGGGYGGAVGAGVDASSGGRSGGNTGGTSRGSSRASQSTRGLGTDDGISSDAIASSQSVSGVSVGSVTDGAIASFSDDDSPTGVYGSLDADPMSMADINAEATSNIQSQAEPGLIGRALSLGASVLGSPVAGLAVDTAARGYSASQDAEAHNAEFGTSVDTGLASNIGSQALGAVGGFAGSRAGSTIGSRIGSAAGLPGAVAGSVLGGVAGKNLGRGLAMGAFEGVSPGDASTPGGEGNRGGDGAGADATMMAGTSPTQAGQSAAQTNTAPSDYGPVDFNGYASYAESFFA